jgi:hypothetical protein
VPYVGLAFLYKRAVVSGARYAVGIREHASIDTLAGFDIEGNRLKQLVMTIYTGPTGDPPLASFSYHT